MDSDKQLLERMQSGDLTAFEGLAQKYYTKLLGFFLKLGLSRQDAQDLAQDTLIKAYEKLARYDERWAFSTWLYSMASNLYKDFLKKNRHAAVALEDAAHLGALQRDDVESFIASHELKRLLSALKPDVRAMLLLHYYSGLSLSEIGRIFHSSPQAVKMKLFRAREKLMNLSNL